MRCNDGVGLFAIGIATLKPQHLQTMTLVTQHKPIERLTDMVLMTKKSQIEAWLNGLYTENRYGQCITSKHVHAGRPGVPAPVMTVKIRLSLPAHNSGSCRFVCVEIKFLLLLSPAIQIAAVSGAFFCKVFYFENCSHLWKTAGMHPKISFCQTIIFPEY